MEGSLKHTRHGHSAAPRGLDGRSPTYNCWRAMIDRCYCQSSTAYPAYGGQGVTVCDEWRTFAAFLADMGERPTKGHSLDRIDNSKGYEPGNCRWATRKEQARNRSCNRFVTARGETLTVGEWAERLGVRRNMIYARLLRGWSDERAVSA